MIWLIYNVVFVIGFACMAPRYLWRMRQRGGYRRDFAQRFGCYRPDIRGQLAEGGRIWIHCVSVGEAFVALALAEELRSRSADLRFLFSTATSTGYALLQDRLRGPDLAVYWPLDLPVIMRRVIELVRPSALVLIEAELWPNVIRLLHARGVPVYLVNGRISQQSFRGYRRARFLTRRILPLFRALCVQSLGDRDRLAALGAPPDRLHLMNSAKYRWDPADPAQEAAAAAALAEAGMGSERPLLLGGSTWPGEEDVLLELVRALRTEFPGLGLILAPRHVERCPEITALIERGGWRMIRRTYPAPPSRAESPPDVFLLDTTGELKHFYRAADVVFIGKSLCAKGGQNIIEPAQAGRAILVGPQMQNFPVILEDFLTADAIVVVQDAADLRVRVRQLLKEADRCRELGDHAANLIRQKAGAIEQTSAMILTTMEAP